MSAHLITEKLTIKRQEGDHPATIRIIVPALIDMSTFTEVKFGVYTSSGTLLFLKSLSNGDIVVSDQNIDISLGASDTTGNAGKHVWECEISKTGECITIGEGSFIIKKQLISNT